jgi:hypothetical protein
VFVNADADEQWNSTSGLTISINGRIDGRAKFWFDQSNFIEVEGDVDTKIYHDWFDDTCQLRYEPSSTNAGTLEVRAQFH